MNWKEFSPYADVKKLNERVVEVSKGVWVIAGKGKIENPPDPCWIILNKTGGVLGDNDRNSILVFSNKQLALDWISETVPEGGAYPSLTDWDSMANRYESMFFDAIIDIALEEYWPQFAPLNKTKLKTWNG